MLEEAAGKMYNKAIGIGRTKIPKPSYPPAGGCVKARKGMME